MNMPEDDTRSGGSQTLHDDQEPGGDDLHPGDETMEDLGGASSPLDAGPPFADWREQLRERVREIRARKEAATARVEAPAAHSSTARPEDPGRQTTADKLAQARVQAARATTPTSPAAGVQAEDTTLGLSPATRAERRADIADVVDSLLEPAAEPTAEDARVAASADLHESHGRTQEVTDDTPADAPLFQDEDGLIDKPPPLDVAEKPESMEPATPPDLERIVVPEPTAKEPDEIGPTALTDETTTSPAETAAAAPIGEAGAATTGDSTSEDSLDEVLESEDNPTGDPGPIAESWRQSVTERALDPDKEPQIPAWVSADPEDQDPIRPPTRPDLSTIPPGMQDVDIPAWALPRQASPAPETLDPDATPETGPEPPAKPEPTADAHLVGEFVAGARRDAATRSQPGTPAETTGEPMTVDSLETTEPAAPETGPETRHFPGLFDAEAADPEPTPRAPALESEPSRSPAEATPGANELEPAASEQERGILAALAEPAAGSGVDVTEPVPNIVDPPDMQADESLAWDLDAPVDPETMLDARRESMDPSAPVSDRVFSAIADGLVLLTMGILLAVAGAAAAGTPVLLFVAAAPIPLAAAWMLFGLVYGMMFIGTCGQTLGKMAMRVRVIGTDSFRVGYSRAARRALLYTLASLPAFLGLLPALKDPEHRALHDRLSGTRVVKA